MARRRAVPAGLASAMGEAATKVAMVAKTAKMANCMFAVDCEG